MCEYGQERVFDSDHRRQACLSLGLSLGFYHGFYHGLYLDLCPNLGRHNSGYHTQRSPKVTLLFEETMRHRLPHYPANFRWRQHRQDQ